MLEKAVHLRWELKNETTQALEGPGVMVHMSDPSLKEVGQKDQKSKMIVSYRSSSLKKPKMKTK